MDTNKDYYRILGVLDDAEDIVIRAAYRALAQRYHPDKWSGNLEEASARMAEINEAYAVLIDASARAAYDAVRREKNADEYGGAFRATAQDKMKRSNDYSENKFARMKPLKAFLIISLVVTVSIFYFNSVFFNKLDNYVGEKNSNDSNEANFSISHLEKECEKNSGEKCFNAGRAFSKAIGVHQDYNKAFLFFEKSCNLGYMKGCDYVSRGYFWGNGVAKDLKAAFNYASKACNGNIFDACSNLASMYMTGEGVSQDFKIALSILEPACKKNHGHSCENIGFMYYEGKGFIANKFKAVDLFEKACSANQGNSCRQLGFMYENGEAVRSDLSKALELYAKACDLKDEEGCKYYATVKNSFVRK
jgi:TPR repeat protein